MNKILKEDEIPAQQPPKPLVWSWIVQRKESQGEAASIWKFGFIAPDGAECRVTFHQIGASQPEAQTPPPPPEPAPAPSQDPQQPVADPSAGAGAGAPGAAGGADMAGAMDPMTGMPQQDPAKFTIGGQPNTDQTQDATFYVTLFVNRNPEHFMKWDVSLSHEDSLAVWVTITHGIVDFIRQAKPQNVVLDDLANGKLKMVLRSVAMDVAAANPEYELEQTQKHHYRSFYQIKKKGTPDAFTSAVQGRGIEGETKTPGVPSPVGEPEKPGTANVPTDQEQADRGIATEDPKENTAPAPSTVQAPAQDDSEVKQPQFPHAKEEPLPIKQTAPVQKHLTVEIGRDYSVAVKDQEGNAVDRYRGKSPADVLRWINKKGYGLNRMVVVDQEQPSGQKKPATKPVVSAPKQVAPDNKEVMETFVIDKNVIRVRALLTAKQAAMLNYIVNAPGVRCTNESVEFEFATDKDMNFKRTLVELACNKVGIVIEARKPDVSDKAKAALAHYGYTAGQEHGSGHQVFRHPAGHSIVLSHMKEAWAHIDGGNEVSKGRFGALPKYLNALHGDKH